MAESTGLEPVHRYPDDGLAIRCITTLPTLRVVTELYLTYVYSLVNNFFCYLLILIKLKITFFVLEKLKIVMY